MTRSQLNLALMVVAAGLGAAVFFGQKKEEKGPPLTTLTADTINKVRIEHPGAPALVLEKAGSAWKLLEPVQAPVDSIEINGVLNLATLETKSTLKLTDLQLADLGLEPALYSVTFNDQKLELGNNEPLNYQRYIRAGDKVVLTEDPPATALDADYSDLVSKQLLPEGAEIVEIRLPGLTIARAADDKGWSLKPEPAPASADQKQKLVDAWKNARAMWNAAEIGETPKGDEVVVTLKDQTLKFLVVEREPQLALVRPDLKVRYTLSKALADELLKLPPDVKEDPKEAKPVAAPAATPAAAQ